MSDLHAGQGRRPEQMEFSLLAFAWSAVGIVVLFIVAMVLA